MSKYAEQITAYEAKRAALVGSMDAIMSKAADEGTTLDASQQEEYDGYDADIKAVDAHLGRLKVMESATAVKTVEAVGGSTNEGSTTRGGERIVVKAQPKLKPGIGFARLAKCLGMAKGSMGDALRIAEARYGQESDAAGVFKAAVTAGSTLSGSWAEDLVSDEGGAFADFVEFLRPQTILGQFGTDGVPQLRNVPFRVPLGAQTGGGDGYWVGEGAAKPLTAFDFSRTVLEPLKVANIAVLTEEVIRDGSANSEQLVRDGLANALRERLDRDFIDPAKAAVAGVSPASITNGAATTQASGTTADNLRADIRAAMGTFIAANNAPTTGVWIMSATTALSISLMLNPLGQPEFPGLGMRGGTLLGLPVIVSEYIPGAYDPDGAGAATAGSLLILVNASDIYLADEGGIQIDLSREASLQMDNAPTMNSTTPTPIAMVSMFQTNSVAFRAERTINWARRRPASVHYVTGVAYA